LFQRKQATHGREEDSRGRTGKRGRDLLLIKGTEREKQAVAKIMPCDHQGRPEEEN